MRESIGGSMRESIRGSMRESIWGSMRESIWGSTMKLDNEWFNGSHWVMRMIEWVFEWVSDNWIAYSSIFSVRIVLRWIESTLLQISLLKNSKQNWPHNWAHGVAKNRYLLKCFPSVIIHVTFSAPPYQVIYGQVIVDSKMFAQYCSKLHPDACAVLLCIPICFIISLDPRMLFLKFSNK